MHDGEPSARGLGRRLAGLVGPWRLLVVAVPTVTAATALVWLLEERFGVLNASPVYLLAVVVTALVSGTAGALAAAVAGILLYDFLFVHPVHTLTITDPGEWLNLVLLLFVGLVVGQLTALERARKLTAEEREREARELFLVSRALATRDSTTGVLPEIAEHLRAAARMTSLWIALGPDDQGEAIAALAGEPPPPATPALRWVLRRTPGAEPAIWVRIHSAGARAPRRQAPPEPQATYRVHIEVGARPLGSIWATRTSALGRPDRSATRLMAAAADQIGQALAQDHLAEEARAAEVARQSDALKSALLQSVSHDLRTPLATIRAAAGTLRPDSDLDPAGRSASAEAIEREVARLDPPEVEEIGDEAIEALDLALDGGRARPPALGVDVALGAKRARGGPDRRERRPEIVRDRLEQRGLESVALARDLGGPRLRREPVRRQRLTDLVRGGRQEPRRRPVGVAAATVARRPHRPEDPAARLDSNAIRLHLASFGRLAGPAGRRRVVDSHPARRLVAGGAAELPVQARAGTRGAVLTGDRSDALAGIVRAQRERDRLETRLAPYHLGDLVEHVRGG